MPEQGGKEALEGEGRGQEERRGVARKKGGEGPGVSSRGGSSRGCQGGGGFQNYESEPGWEMEDPGRRKWLIHGPVTFLGMGLGTVAGPDKCPKWNE